jgi:serine/threonine-protein kinase
VFAQGSVIAGKYRVDHVLGEGGMGMVVAATHLGLGTRVALKFLHAALATNPDVVERFAREARASAQLRGEHVCRVSDVGQFEDGTPYMVMELLDGQDLASVLRTHGPLPANMVCDYVLQACLAIGEAHQLGIVHRDLKPGNIFLSVRTDGTPLVKVLDFGVAKAPQEGNFSLTQTATVIGSPGYMSPEQLRSSKEADARSDIWSLGVTIYELVAGRQPWVAGSITELTLRIAMDPLPPLPPTVPPGLATVIETCMQKDPAARYQDISALAAALAPFASHGGHELAGGVSRVLRGSAPAFVPAQNAFGSAPTVASTGGTSTPTTLRGASGVITPEPGRRSRKLAVMIGAAVGVGAAIVIVMLTARGGGPADPHASTNAPAATTPTPATTPATAPATPTTATTATTPTAPTSSPPATTPPATTPPATTPPATTPPATAVTTPAPATPTPPVTPDPKLKKPAPHKQPKHTAEDINDSRI